MFGSRTSRAVSERLYEAVQASAHEIVRRTLIVLLPPGPSWLSTRLRVPHSSTSRRICRRGASTCRDPSRKRRNYSAQISNCYQYAKNERLILEKGKGDLDVQFFRMFDFPTSGSGVVLDGRGKNTQEKHGRVREAQHKEFLAWLDTRRIPLKDELVDLWVKNVIVKAPTSSALTVNGVS